MRNPFRTDDPALDKAIADATAEMLLMTPGTSEYDAKLAHVERLYTIKTSSRRKRVSPDAWVGLAATLGSVLIIVMYEQKHVMTSKAQGFIPKNNTPHNP